MAYHVGLNTWFQLPDHPGLRYCSSVTSVGNRYIFIAGGIGNAKETSSVIALDWAKKQWHDVPSLPDGVACGTATFTPGPSNKLIVMGVDGNRNGRFAFKSFNLEVAPGIGWEKEKQLLLAFLGKAKKKRCEKICPLEGLPSGVFANILSYLIVPFLQEVNCKGSIFKL